MSSTSVELVTRAINDFKSRHGLADETATSIISTLHLMNTHQIDLAGAQERTSRGGTDHGINGWFLDSEASTLFLYQSRLGETKTQVLRGLDELKTAAGWVGALVTEGDAGRNSSNIAINNLIQNLISLSEKPKRVELVLLSTLSEDDIVSSNEFGYAGRDLSKLPLFKSLKRQGGLSLRAAPFNLRSEGVAEATQYGLTSRESTQLALGGRSELKVSMVSLYSLVELLRKRGNLVFEKNVRLHLNTKESRTRVEHPLEATLAAITDGRLDPNYFTAYHVGVAITASAYEEAQDGQLFIELPYIINGCQTVSVANRFLVRLEKAKQIEKIDRFKHIHVIAKVVTRAPEDQLREIATCNNRQNPIEGWQLFSNDPIHVEIEAALRERGVFYERQKGKFASDAISQRQGVYPGTHGTYVEVLGLGQGIVLCRGQLSLAAKPSEIFSSKERHDAVFSADLPGRVSDIIWTFNAMKALKRSLIQYLHQATHSDETSQNVFNRPVIRHALNQIGMLDLVQKRREFHEQFTKRLYKRASPSLVDALQPVWRKSVAKMKRFCAEETDGPNGEVTSERLEAFVHELASDQGLSPAGAMPFTSQSVKWQPSMT